MAENDSTILKVDSLVSGYGQKKILHGITLDVRKGEVQAVIGHNGAGKSTLLKVLFGLAPIWEGQINYHGLLDTDLVPRQLIRSGVTYVPQGNVVFGDLTLHENLNVAGSTLRNASARREAINRVVEQYPSLKARLAQRASTLSGGEKQMLAIAMCLMLYPRLLLLDEPSLGLAPSLVTQVLEHVRQINQKLGVSVLIVEQKVRDVLTIADRVCVLKGGSVSFNGKAAELNDDKKLKEVYL